MASISLAKVSLRTAVPEIAIELLGCNGNSITS